MFEDLDGKELTVEEYASWRLDGSDYDRGELETIRAEAENVKEAFSRLLGVLHAKGALSDAEAFKVVCGFSPGEDE